MDKTNTSKGIFIVIDGTDGSGKTTQLNILVKKLREQGHEVEVADFPQYNQKSAGLVEEYLGGKYGTADEVGPYTASVFYAVDRFDASFKLKEWINQGKIIISNRYVSASMGHQGGKIKNPEDRKKYLEWLQNFEYNVMKIPQPDLTLILHVDSEISQKLSIERKREDWKDKTKDIHEENLQHLKDAEKTYLEIAQLPKFQLVECCNNNQILPIEEIHKLIWNQINHLLN
ncbi:MAG: deoxynucleoside kinase [Nanoarchaeota archaeon]|nr:deoxynucleoside kinase [Nanoarchaeota archaeon]